jgi:hypothetical protein
MSATTLHFRSPGHSLEIEADIAQDASLQSYGDAHVRLLLDSGGFAGRNATWLRREDLERFAGRLAALERAGEGEATLASMSPHALELAVRTVASGGHVALSGGTGHLVRGEHTQFWHAVSFGFEFERGQLSEALAGSWLGRYLGGFGR